MSASAVTWQLEGDAACLSCGPLRARVELDGLGTRLVVSTWRGELSDAFGALITAGPGPRPKVLTVAERYIRGHDYVASYAATSDYPVVPHFYWRAKFHAALSAVQIEMILSVQTNLLDSQPEANVASFALEARLFHSRDLTAPQFEELSANSAQTRFGRARSPQHLFVFRNENLGLSYAQLVHPSDFVATEVNWKESRLWVVNSTLFPESLEKGVIRRGRICVWFLPAENDLENAVELARQFVDEPLPLTA
jgi:hypothetical protein